TRAAAPRPPTPSAGSAGEVLTWLFEEGSFAPVAKLTAQGAYSVVADHLGTPLELYDQTGQKTWQAQLDCYGGVRQGRGQAQDCPFRYQGQYEDVETGLYYNRFRYYDPEVGSYISQDPIRLNGGRRLYGYVSNPESWVDIFGLGPVSPGDTGAFGTLGGEVGDGLTAHHMPQDALGFLPRDEGGAIVMPHDEHVQTRTYGSKGRATKAADRNRPFKDVLQDDIRDIRRIGGDKYDGSIEKLIKYYENKGLLRPGELNLADICK
ncbi:MAG: hypothetical protein EOO63_12450, partial [Hymenobacter sp.]